MLLFRAFLELTIYTSVDLKKKKNPSSFLFGLANQTGSKFRIAAIFDSVHSFRNCVLNLHVEQGIFESLGKFSSHPPPSISPDNCSQQFCPHPNPYSIHFGCHGLCGISVYSLSSPHLFSKFYVLRLLVA